MPAPRPRPNVAAIPAYVAGKPPVPREGLWLQNTTMKKRLGADNDG